MANMTGVSFFITLSALPPTSCLVKFISVSRRRRGLRRQTSRGSLLVGTRPFLNHVENRRNKENSNRAGSRHPADNCGPHDLPRTGPGAARCPQRHATQDEREGRHQNGPETQSGSLQRGVRQRLPFLELILRKFHDQNRVLRGQPDEHHQSDLRVDIALYLHHVGRQKNALQEAAQEQNGEGAENRYWRTKQNAKRQRPTFIERCQDQENEQKGKSENHRGRYAFTGLLFLKRHPRVVETHFARHGLLEDFFQRRSGLICAITRRGAAIKLRRTVLVEAKQKFRAEARFHSDQRRERNILSFVVANVELADVLRLRAIFAFRFNVHLPLAAAAIEIVDEIAAPEGLDGLVHVAKVHALLQNFVAVHIDKLLRHVGQESRAQAGDFRPLSGSFHKGGQVFCEELNITARTVFQHERKASGGSHTRNRRRRKPERHGTRQLAQLLIQMRLKGLKLLFTRLALIPELEVHEERRVVSGARKAQ